MQQTEGHYSNPTNCQGPNISLIPPSEKIFVLSSKWGFEYSHFYWMLFIRITVYQLQIPQMHIKLTALKMAWCKTPLTGKILPKYRIKLNVHLWFSFPDFVTAVGWYRMYHSLLAVHLLPCKSQHLWNPTVHCYYYAMQSGNNNGIGFLLLKIN